MVMVLNDQDKYTLFYTLVQLRKSIMFFTEIRSIFDVFNFYIINIQTHKIIIWRAICPPSIRQKKIML